MIESEKSLEPEPPPTTGGDSASRVIPSPSEANSGATDAADEDSRSLSDSQPTWVSWATVTPLAAGTTGSLSLLISVSGLADPFRQTVDDHGHSIYDPKPRWVVAVASASLGLEILGNIALFLNFYGHILSYKLAMAISLVSFSSKVIMLFSLIGTFRVLYPDPGRLFYSQGYWMTVGSAVLTFFSVAFLTLNYAGYRRHYYRSFTISVQERLLVMQVMVWVVWMAIGALGFALAEKWPFVKSLYFITVSLLTLGFGDVVLKSTVGRALLLPYCFIGIALLGLVISTIRTVVIETAREKILRKHMENIRRRRLLRFPRTPSVGPPDEAEQLHDYEKMREDQKRLERSRTFITAWSMIAIFIVFWITGSAVFSATEGWSFFVGFYFSFVSLTTIGYGDFTVGTDPGRAIFIIWSLLAVPVMTILVSSVGDAFASLLEKQTKPDEHNDNSPTSTVSSLPLRELPDDTEQLSALVRERLPSELLDLSDKLVKYAQHVADDRRHYYNFHEYRLMLRQTGIEHDFRPTAATQRVGEELLFLQSYQKAVERVTTELKVALTKMEAPTKGTNEQDS